MTAPTEKGSIASMVNDSSGAPLVDLPWPRAMADSIDALENEPFFAFVIAVARRGLKVGSGPATAAGQHIWLQVLGATFYLRLDARMISWDSIERALLFAASLFPLSCLILDHLLWPEASTAAQLKLRRELVRHDEDKQL